MPTDRLPTAAEVLAGLPPALEDDGRLRESVRAMRAADGLLLGALDDDPTGSQAVHGVQVVTVLEQDAYQAASQRGPGLLRADQDAQPGRPAAVERTGRRPTGLMPWPRSGARGSQLVSRSDSTLRGACDGGGVGAWLRAPACDALGRGFDGVLLVPAFLEAGRLTAGDIHWARVGGELIPVGQTEFAQGRRVRLFGASDLKDFISGEKRREDQAGTRSPASAWPTSGSAGRPGSPTCWPGCGTGPGPWSTPPSTPTSRRWPAGCCWPSGPADRSVPHRALVRAGPGRAGPDGTTSRPGHLARAPPPRARPDRGRIPRQPDQPAAGRARARGTPPLTSNSTSPPPSPAADQVAADVAEQVAGR